MTGLGRSKAYLSTAGEESTSSGTPLDDLLQRSPPPATSPRTSFDLITERWSMLNLHFHETDLFERTRQLYRIKIDEDMIRQIV